MNRKSRVPQVNIPPREYSRDDLNKAFQTINAFIDQSYNPGDVVATSLQFINVARNGYGLPMGGVFVDGDGILRMVLPTDIFAPSMSVRTRLGAVTVTTT